jgi:hypothetical protein
MQDVYSLYQAGKTTKTGLGTKRVFTLKDIIPETKPGGGVEVKTSQGQVMVQIMKTETKAITETKPKLDFMKFEKVLTDAKVITDTKTTLFERMESYNPIKPKVKVVTETETDYGNLVIVTEEQKQLFSGTLLSGITGGASQIFKPIQITAEGVSTAGALKLGTIQTEITRQVELQEISLALKQVTAQVQIQPQMFEQPQLTLTRQRTGTPTPTFTAEIQIPPEPVPTPGRGRGGGELKIIKEIEIKLPFLFPLGGGKEEKKKKKSQLRFTGKVSGRKSLYSDLLSVAQTELGVGAGRARHPSLKKHPELWKGEATGRIPTSQMLKLGGTRNALKSIRGNLFGKMKKVKYI